eukprot:364710-Chlamydomonas_euryale.AAC.2
MHGRHVVHGGRVMRAWRAQCALRMWRACMEGTVCMEDVSWMCGMHARHARMARPRRTMLILGVNARSDCMELVYGVHPKCACVG